MASSEPSGGSASDNINVWPAMVDVVASVLMVFLLVTYLNTHLNVANFQVLVIADQQEEFQKLFEREFDGELKEEKVAIKPDGLDSLRITFSDQVLFDRGKHKLKYSGRIILRRFAQLLAKAKATGYERIQIEGHTDEVPLSRGRYPGDNWELSSARALAVLHLLTRTSETLTEKVSANAYADQQPVPGEARDSKLNRRVDILLFFSAEPTDADDHTTQSR